MVELLVIGAVIGLLPAYIAKQKGYSFGDWWIFGALLFIIALPMALLRKPNQAKRRDCPFCRTSIDRLATVCPQCSRDVPQPGQAPPEPYSVRPWER